VLEQVVLWTLFPAIPNLLSALTQRVRSSACFAEDVERSEATAKDGISRSSKNLFGHCLVDPSEIHGHCQITTIVKLA